MPKQPETKFKDYFLTRLRQIPESWWEKKEAGAIRGLPDILGCKTGILCALEMKKDLASAKEKSGRIVLQRYTLSKIAKAGGYTAIVSPENAESVLQEITRIQGKKSKPFLPRCLVCGNEMLSEWLSERGETTWSQTEMCTGCASGS